MNVQNLNDGLSLPARLSRYWALLLLCGFVLQPVSAASIFNYHSQNGIVAIVEAQGLYEGATVTDMSPLATGFASLAGDPPFLNRAGMSADATALLNGGVSYLPTSGDGLLDGKAVATIYFGDATTDDELTVDLEATASALSAQNSIGENSDATAHLRATFQFSIDPVRVAAGTFMGTMDFPDQPAVTDYDFKTIQVVEYIGATPTTVGTGTPGSAAFSVDLYSGRAYEIIYDLVYSVPFGIDPHFRSLDSIHFRASAAATVIPLPASIWMGMSALAFLLGTQRRYPASH